MNKVDNIILCQCEMNILFWLSHASSLLPPDTHTSPHTQIHIPSGMWPWGSGLLGLASPALTFFSRRRSCVVAFLPASFLLLLVTKYDTWLCFQIQYKITICTSCSGISYDIKCKLRKVWLKFSSVLRNIVSTSKNVFCKWRMFRQFIDSVSFSLLKNVQY